MEPSCATFFVCFIWFGCGISPKVVISLTRKTNDDKFMSYIYYPYFKIQIESSDLFNHTQSYSVIFYKDNCI